jgi:hypothetical protein
MARLSKNKKIRKQPSPEDVAEPNHTPNHISVNHTSNTGNVNPTPTVHEDPLNDLDTPEDGNDPINEENNQGNGIIHQIFGDDDDNEGKNKYYYNIDIH